MGPWQWLEKHLKNSPVVLSEAWGSSSLNAQALVNMHLFFF